MKLTTEPKKIEWTESHYVFVEKIGNFMQTAPACWQELHALLPQLKAEFRRHASLYKIHPQMIYRAGAFVSVKPEVLPVGLSYEKFDGGLYAAYTLTGSYSQLPEACGKVFEMVKEQKLPLREGYFIENYVNDPRTTPEDQLLTEILLPVRL